jgi:hypothetical protein
MAVAANYGQHFAGRRWNGRGWTKEQLALLGKRPDAELAARFGRSESAVRQRRTRLRIPTFRDGRQR